MAHALNLTLPLKKDEKTRAILTQLPQIFAAELQPKIDAALRESQIVHYARLVVIGDQYVQILTEFDGDKRAYTDFFIEKLPDVFAKVFALVEGAPAWSEFDPDSFFRFAKAHDIRPLGTGEDGYLFCAYGDATVREIRGKLNA
jgi:hypothetical protein